MNDFLSWCMHLLVPSLFHDVTSPSFHRNDFSTCLNTLARGIDLREIFKEAEFDIDPERAAFDCLSEKALGNITWVCTSVASKAKCLMQVSDCRNQFTHQQLGISSSVFYNLWTRMISRWTFLSGQPATL